MIQTCKNRQTKWTKRLLVHDERLFTLNFFISYSSKKLPPQLADTSQTHLVTAPLGIKSAYRACNNLIACNHPVPVRYPASHVDWMPTIWNTKFQQQDQIKANRTAPTILIHCMIFRRAHQILQHYVCSVLQVL
jgi:hypothetical protein